MSAEQERAAVVACGTCRFWENGVQGDPQHGLCHRYPPHMVVTIGDNADIGHMWPETLAHDYCGDFMAKRQRPKPKPRERWL